MNKKYLALAFTASFALVVLGAGCTQNRPVDINNKPPVAGETTKTYTSKDPKLCETLRFQCKKGEEAFVDSTGCGCAKSEVMVGNDQDCDENTDKPVCGELEVQCIKAPCPPLKRTYTNLCYAKKENAQNIVDGACVQTIGNEYIEVSSPQANEKIVGSSVNVKARVLAPWLSEAVAPIEVTDFSGKVLGTGQIVGPNDWMTRNGWMQIETKVDFKNNGAKKGFVVFKKDNPSGDPKRDQQVKVPVNF
jgi:hypothetical protein